MASGGRSFNYFPENQLTVFKLYPLPSPTDDFCGAFYVAGGAFGLPCQLVQMQLWRFVAAEETDVTVRYFHIANQLPVHMR